MARDIDLNSLDNLFDNAVQNIIQVFKDHQKDELNIRLRKIYDDDIQNPEARSVAVDIQGHTTIMRSWIGRTKRNFLSAITVHIWYYHEELTETTRKREVTTMLGRISNMFLKHSSINGFCDVLGSNVVGSEYLPRKLKNKIMAGGLVRLTLNKYHTVTSLD